MGMALANELLNAFHVYLLAVPVFKRYYVPCNYAAKTFFMAGAHFPHHACITIVLRVCLSDKNRTE